MLAWPTLPKLMVQATRSGWYYRVIEPGIVSTGDEMTLISRCQPEWSVAHVFRLVMHTEARNHDALCAVAQLDVLEIGWRNAAAALIS